VYLGIVGICDPPKPFVRESIEQLFICGVKVKLVTGDAQETAVAIGKLIAVLDVCELTIITCQYILTDSYCSF